MSKQDVARREFLAGAALGAGVVAGGRLLPEASAQTHAQRAAANAPAPICASSYGDGHGAFLNEADAETVAAFTERLMPGAPGKPGPPHPCDPFIGLSCKAAVGGYHISVASISGYLSSQTSSMRQLLIRLLTIIVQPLTFGCQQ